MNYPVVTAGLVMGPRGVGTMAAMLVVGRLVGRVDTRLLLGIGLGLTAWSFYAMTGWTPDISQSTIIGVGVVQGIGLGFLFVPLSAATLSTLSPQPAHRRRRLLQSVPQYRLERRHLGGECAADPQHPGQSRRHRRSMSPPSTAAFENPAIAHFWNPLTAAGRAALDAVITQQAQIIAYIDDYKLLMIATLAVIPLLIVFKKAAKGRGSDHLPIAE